MPGGSRKKQVWKTFIGSFSPRRVSLKSSNLIRCAEPLHRWHRLPTYAEPPFFVNTAIAAQELYARCLDLAVKVLGYPAPPKLHDLKGEPAEVPGSPEERNGKTSVSGT